MACGPLIFLRPKYRNDEGLYRHELQHVKQWWFTLGFHSLFYTFSDVYKLWAEVEAYKVQAKCYPDDRSEVFATFISTNYGLDVSLEQALVLLKE